MPFSLSLPPVASHPAHPPEIRPAKVGAWLEEMARREPASAAHLIGDALAATNRVAMSDSKRLELAEMYWTTANTLWPLLEKQFVRASHPLSGEALEAAKAALTLSSELTTAYKHLLVNEADKRISLGGQRLMVALVHRCLQCTARILVNSYLSFAPVPPRTWHDSHLIYMFARDRNIHLTPVASDQPEATPERLTVQSLLLALANPYGFLPGQLPIVLRYVLETCATVEQAVSALRRIPVAQSYNVALVDTIGNHATVFVAPQQRAVVSRLDATTNHRLDLVEHPAHAARFNSVGRLTRLDQLRADDASAEQLVAAMLRPPLRNDQFEIGFGTLYTAMYEPAAGTATWHWPETSWTRRFDDPDDVRTVNLAHS